MWGTHDAAGDMRGERIQALAVILFIQSMRGQRRGQRLNRREWEVAGHARRIGALLGGPCFEIGLEGRILFTAGQGEPRRQACCAPGHGAEPRTSVHTQPSYTAWPARRVSLLQRFFVLAPCTITWTTLRDMVQEIYEKYIGYTG